MKFDFGDIPIELAKDANKYKSAYLMLYVLVRDFPLCDRAGFWNPKKGVLASKMRDLKIRNKEKAGDIFASIIETLLDEPLWPFYITYKMLQQQFYEKDGTINERRFPKGNTDNILPKQFLHWKNDFFNSEELKRFPDLHTWAKLIATGITPEPVSPPMQVRGRV